MREKETFRDELVRLDQQFPDKELLTTKEASKYLGITVDTFKRYYTDKLSCGRYISKVVLARTLSI